MWQHSFRNSTDSTEAVVATCADEVLDLLGIREEHLDGAAVLLARGVDERVRLLEEPAGIEREDADRQVGAPDGVGDDLVFLSE